MNIYKDIHICGICERVFNDIKIFLEHKSKCFLSLNNAVVLSSNPQDVSLESGLFSSQTVLDLTVLENGSFPFLLQCDNEEVEVVSDNNPFELQEENSTDSQLDQVVTAKTIINNINEEVATLLITQLSKEVIAPERNLHVDGQTSEVSNGEHLNESEHPLLENGLSEEVVEKNSSNKKQKNICNICNFATTHQRDLVRHMRIHTGERPYICCVCDKTFSRQDKLTTHKRIHSGDKRYKCQLCNYATTDSGALRKHLRIHTDERPHKCQMCSYQARNTSQMTVHLRTHTGDSPFFCQLETCQRSFKTSTDLKRHLKVHKLDSLSPTYSSFDDVTEKFSCKHLLKHGKLFKRQSSCYMCQDFVHKDVNKKRHGVRMRRGMRVLCAKTHECPHCGAAFVRQDSLRSHLKLHQQSTSPIDTSLELDEEDLERENGSVRSQSPELTLSRHSAAKRGPAALYADTCDGLQDTLIPLDEDGTGQYIIDNAFL